ncbi:lipid droplet-associated protein [Actinophytocola sp. NPDC049390]|uniref:lipid droplet-associated protein n=1 Tax=Actinophytocola sp. NPDC049390 TaxID=3363894 RepID=UPI0037BC45D7
MKSLPLPVRVAAGLAVMAVEQARTLPAKIAGLPVTVASQALQVSMRVQQQITELAIRGDEVLAGLRPVEETPEWATFDEDVADDRFDFSRPAPFESAFDRAEDEDDEERRNGHHSVSAETFATPDPWTQEEQAIAEETEAHDGPVDDPIAGRDDDRDDDRPLPEATGYDELSLPQLRARLRQFNADELAELLEYERTHGNRPSFVGMLTRRIATVRDQT